VVMRFFGNAPLTTNGQLASILQCLDRSIEFALGLVKIGRKIGKTLF